MAIAERLTQLGAGYGLEASSVERLAGLLSALAAEPSPPTTVAEPSAAVDVHIADSLSGLEADPVRKAKHIADIGAGAGFPGLVLASALAGARVDLIEATRRKCDLIARLAASAGIENAEPVGARAEEWGAADGSLAYDLVTARALASLPVLLEYAAPLLDVGGHLVAWKGSRDSAEEASGMAAAELLGLEGLGVVPVRPFRGSRERNLYVYRKAYATPGRFPRRPGMAAKRPLA